MAEPQKSPAAAGSEPVVFLMQAEEDSLVHWPHHKLVCKQLRNEWLRQQERGS